MRTRTNRMVMIAVCLLVNNLWAGEETRTQNNKNTQDELVIFDAAAPEKCKITNSTAKWKKGSDLTPVANLVERNGEKWYEVSYTGSRGKAISNFMLPDETAGQLRRWKHPGDGIKLVIDYDKNDFGKLAVHVAFVDKTIVAHVLTLEPGTREYIVTKGFRRATFPPDWKLLRSVSLLVSAKKGGNRLKYRLKSISAVPGKAKSQVRALRIEQVRRIQEILPLTGAVAIDGILNDAAWKDTAQLDGFYYHASGNFVSGPESPLSVRIGYDDKNLYIASVAEFPTAPQAIVTKRDAAVYQDEAIEYFFSAENDNDKRIQFVVNAKGAIFDAVREFDVTACRVMNISAKNIAHEKTMRYDGKSWIIEMAFPLTGIKVNLGKRRFIGFQLAQNYRKRSEPRLQSLTWSASKRYPDPRLYGMLVFNRRPFGPGEITVNSIVSIAAGNNRANYIVKASCKGFAKEKYRLVATIAAADCTMLDWEKEIDLTGGDRDVTFTIPNFKNCNGVYALYLALFNGEGNLKLAAVNFNNAVEVGNLFGLPILLPKPKQVVWGEGDFPARSCEALYIAKDATPRTRKTARLFADKYYGYAGRHLVIRESEKPEQENGVIMRINRDVTFKGKKSEFHEEGYCLKVTPKRVEITGFDEPGLHYGGVTFLLLLRHRMAIREKRPVHCVEILDWPDLHHRIVMLNHPWHFANRKFREIRPVEFLMDWIDRFIADGKANLLRLDISDLIRYRRRPEFNGPERIYSLRDLERLAEFCRDRFVEICPEWEIGGHANWWLLGYHPELREKGYAHQADVTHPDHDPIVYDCMRDVIEAIKPKYMSPKGDEWWHSIKSDEEPSPLLHNGQTRAEAFLSWHVKFNDWLRSQHIRMLMYEDMLSPYHNGKRYDLYKIIDRFPKDIVITPWGSQNPDRTIRYFTDKGFEVWTTNTGWWTCNKSTKTLVKGFGKAVYSFGPSWYLCDKYGASKAHYPYGLFRAEDYAWNIISDKGDTVNDQIENGRLIAVRNILAVRPNPYAAETFKRLDLSSVMNSNLDDFLKTAKPEIYAKDKPAVIFPDWQTEVGNIPTSLSHAAKNCVAIQPGEKVNITIEPAQYSSLVFLHTAYIDNKYAKAQKLGWRLWPYGYPCGKYMVEYEDGEVRVLNLRIGENIRWIDGNSFMRCTNENRFILPLKDANGNELFLYQWEWVNPRPRAKIVKVILAHDNVYDIKVLLFALSGRGVQIPE